MKPKVKISGKSAQTLASLKAAALAWGMCIAKGKAPLRLRKRFEAAINRMEKHLAKLELGTPQNRL